MVQVCVCIHTVHEIFHRLKDPLAVVPVTGRRHVVLIMYVYVSISSRQTNKRTYMLVAYIHMYRYNVLLQSYQPRHISLRRPRLCHRAN